MTMLGKLFPGISQFNMRVLLTKDHYIVINTAEGMCKGDRNTEQVEARILQGIVTEKVKYLLVFKG